MTDHDLWTKYEFHNLLVSGLTEKCGGREQWKFEIGKA